MSNEIWSVFIKFTQTKQILSFLLSNLSIHQHINLSQLKLMFKLDYFLLAY